MPRKPKYNKTMIETWKCGSCEWQWHYQTMKCPLCCSGEMLKMN